MIYIDILIILVIGKGHCPRPWKPHLSISVLPLNHAIFPMPLYFWARDSDMTHSCIICITLAVAFLKDHSVPVSGVSIGIISEIIIEQLSSCPYRE